MARSRTAMLGVLAFVSVGSCLRPSVVMAHGSGPPDITFWGPFPGASQCQRLISDAARRCFERVLAIQRRCMDAQLAGHPCDGTLRDTQIAAAKQSAQEQVGNACSVLQVQQLRFVSVDEAKADVTKSCGDQADAAISVLYGPAVVRGSGASVDPAMQSCLARTSALGAKLLHVVVRLRDRVFDRIAVRDTPFTQKHALLAQVSARVAAARQKLASAIDVDCPNFAAIYDRTMTSFLDMLEPRGDCVVYAGYVQSAVTCPTPACGNGVKEPGEQCDDGNRTDNDLCHDNCTKNDCSVFPSTYALIQAAIFQKYDCANESCHGSARQGGLDLRAGVSYADIVGTPSQIAPDLKRIEPGDETRSLLWLKLAASTLGRKGVPGSPMPVGPTPLSANELEALRLWIHAAAPETGNAGGVAELLDACAVPADPIAIQPPDPPVVGSGVQLHMPRWNLPAHSESEVCFATYYDLSAQVPPEALGGDGRTFRFHRQDIVQDPQSHHLIVNFYHGDASIDDPAWGAFTCKGGPMDGQPCDPKQANACGSQGGCGSPPTSSVACIGFGPADSQINFTGFTGTQQTAYELTYAEGVYEEIPLKGIIIWNSHAFNLTRQDTTQEAWLNFYFAPKLEQKYPVQGIFDISDIFWRGQSVAPFQSREFCNDYILEQGARLFEISSHMHKRGKRFTIAGPPGSQWSYTSTIYNDPIQLHFDPPLAFDDPAPAARTLHYCALYDNGAMHPDEVKEKSTSPETPLGFPFGGPCAIPSGCTKGRVGQPCSGSTAAKRNTACDTSPGAGDGFCDACPLMGGVTTEDEMFILLGAYYKP